MNPQISLQDFTALMNFFETPHSCRSASVVTSKVDQRLFALENCAGTWLFSIRAICRHVCAVSTARQSDFHCARGVAVPLRPNESEAFQTNMRLCFAVTIRQALIHFA